MTRNLLKIYFFILLIVCYFSTTSYALSPQSDLIYEGIDVSSWQGEIDFEKVKNFGIDVVYIKASEGTTYINSYLDSYYNNAKKNNLKIGFYHFLTATSVYEAEQEADFFASAISRKKF